MTKKLFYTLYRLGRASRNRSANYAPEVSYARQFDIAWFDAEKYLGFERVKRISDAVILVLDVLDLV